MKEIELSNGNIALVDDEDFEKLNRHSWSPIGWGYARAGINGKTVYMHRFIMDAKSGQVIDHINGNGLDNRKSNLRFADPKKQMQNTKKMNRNCSSSYKGVRKLARCKNSWNVRIAHQHIGCFNDEIVAATIYDYHARETYKEFARLNFPDRTIDEATYKKLFNNHAYQHCHGKNLRKPASKLTLGS